MGQLTYTCITSLDGYVADSKGNFDWSAPDEEVHAFVNDLERDVGTFLLGRRMYDVLAVWDTMDTPDAPAVIRDYARIWKAADKVVYSSSLADPATSRTRVERTFDPDAVRAMKAATDRTMSIGGANLAGLAFAAGLMDECGFLINPVVVGGGLRALPDNLEARLELLDERRFGNGVVYLRYRCLP